MAFCRNAARFLAASSSHKPILDTDLRSEADQRVCLNLAMQLLESMVGKFKIKLGLLLSVDKLHSAIFWITVIGGLLILAGAVIFFLAFYPMLKSNKLKDEQIQPQQ